jgi:hypothetical protein
MYRNLVVVALCVTGSAFVAAPAGAEAPNVGPNCQGIVESVNVVGIGAKEAAANLGLSVKEAEDLIRAVCADVTSNAPRCEVGQEQAAQQALARGDLDQYLFHLGVLFACFLGQSPGPPL